MNINLREYRNWSLGFGYFVLCGFLGWTAGADHVGDLGAVFTGLGIGVTGIIGMRAFNKKAENSGTGT